MILADGGMLNTNTTGLLEFLLLANVTRKSYVLAHFTFTYLKNCRLPMAKSRRKPLIDWFNEKKLMTDRNDYKSSLALMRCLTANVQFKSWLTLIEWAPNTANFGSVLTLKAPIKIAADDKFCAIFLNFQKKGMIFHENRLTILMKYHALFVAFEKATQFEIVVCCKS